MEWNRAPRVFIKSKFRVGNARLFVLGDAEAPRVTQHSGHGDHTAAERERALAVERIEYRGAHAVEREHEYAAQPVRADLHGDGEEDVKPREKENPAERNAREREREHRAEGRSDAFAAVKAVKYADGMAEHRRGERERKPDRLRVEILRRERHGEIRLEHIERETQKTHRHAAHGKHVRSARIFVGAQRGSICVQELRLCLNESAENISVYGANCRAIVRGEGSLTIEQAMQIYDLFEAVVEAELNTLHSLLISIEVSTQINVALCVSAEKSLCGLIAQFPDFEWEQDEDGLQYVVRKLE